MFRSLLIALSAMVLFATVLAAPSARLQVESARSTSRKHGSRRNALNHHKLAASITPATVPTQDLTPDQKAYLTTHNLLRKKSGAVSLSWSDELAAAAQQWANGCKFEHSGGSLGSFGENLAAGTGDFSIPAAVDVWAEEESKYDASSPSASDFTQMVWKSTTEVGCAVAECNNIFSPSLGVARYYVCEYFPAGNVVGQFKENV